MATQNADHAADYASRGRAFKPLTDEQLGQRWVHVYRKMADAPTDRVLRALEMDLKAEFHLRNIEPPFEKVKSETDRYTAFVSSSLETLKRDDPEKVAEVDEDLERDIACVKARMKRSN